MREILLSIHFPASKMLVSAKHHLTIFPNSIGAIFHKESSNTCCTNVIQAWSSSSSISSTSPSSPSIFKKVIQSEHIKITLQVAAIKTSNNLRVRCPLFKLFLSFLNSWLMTIQRKKVKLSFEARLSGINGTRSNNCATSTLQGLKIY